MYCSTHILAILWQQMVVVVVIPSQLPRHLANITVGGQAKAKTFTVLATRIDQDRFRLVDGLGVRRPNRGRLGSFAIRSGSGPQLSRQMWHFGASTATIHP